MEVKYYSQEKLLIFKITEEIDECKVKNIRRRADYEIERFMPKRVVFDFDRVSFMDSSGIGMVIGRYKQTTMLGGKMELANLTEEVRKIFEENDVRYQIAELGKVDIGGGGTIAYILANKGIDVIDCGVPVLSMHSPYEVTSKLDLYEAHRGYEAFWKNA